MILKYWKAVSDVKSPRIGTKGSACFDLATYAGHILEPHSWLTLDLHIGFSIPKGYCLEMYPRSSLQTKYGLINCTSIIDSDYTGTVHALLFNPTDSCIELRGGIYIVQCKLQKVYVLKLKEATALKDKTTRGNNGLGSTGE